MLGKVELVLKVEVIIRLCLSLSIAAVFLAVSRRDSIGVLVTAIATEHIHVDRRGGA